MSSISIRPVRTAKDVHRFVKFLWKIYDGNPSWVPPLIMDRKKLIDRRNNPFYKHADAEFFVAERDGTMVGRIGAIVNHRHTAEHQDAVGFFGFFECVNDREVARSLFEAAEDFLRRRGMTSVRGPANPSVNDEYGMLIEGFDLPPMILMPYNPPYYPELVEACGFRRARDLYAYELTQQTVYSEKLERVTNAVRDRHRLKFRSIDLKQFPAEVDRIKQVYNDAWMKNWGAVPMTDEETDALAKDLRPIVVPELVFFAEVDGKPVGFALSLPDINVALRHNRRGWLIPGVLRLLWHRKKINAVRIIALGVLPEYQASGAAGVLFFETAQRAKRLGYEIGEASWVLEDNTKMVKAAEALNGRLYKKYRIYEKTL